MDKNTKVTGRRIYLRGIRSSDVDSSYYNWMKDPEVTDMLEARFSKWPAKKLKNYIKESKKDPASLFFAIIKKDDDAHIGNVKLTIDKNHGFADIGIIIGDKACWGRGFAPEVLKLVKDYSFKKLKLRKLVAEVYSSNKGSLKAFKKAGFIIEGKRKMQYLHNGRCVDAVFLGLFKK